MIEQHRVEFQKEGHKNLVWITLNIPKLSFFTWNNMNGLDQIIIIIEDLLCAKSYSKHTHYLI